MATPTLAEILAKIAALPPRGRATALRSLADTIDDAEDARARVLGLPVPERDRRRGVITVKFVRQLIRPGETGPSEEWIDARSDVDPRAFSPDA